MRDAKLRDPSPSLTHHPIRRARIGKFVGSTRADFRSEVPASFDLGLLVLRTLEWTGRLRMPRVHAATSPESKGSVLTPWKWELVEAPEIADSQFEDRWVSGRFPSQAALRRAALSATRSEQRRAGGERNLRRLRQHVHQ